MEEKSNKKSALMKEIMDYDFAASELVLFLDVNPHDIKALEMYQSVVKKLKHLTEEYNCTYGPITNKDNKSQTSWDWIDGPWPWEN